MNEIILFSSIVGAEEVAFILRAEWDGCNAVTINDDTNRSTLRLAANLIGADYCLSEMSCHLKISTVKLLSFYASGITDFRGIELRGADLSGVNLAGACFDEADLRDVNFEGADLSRASFVMAKLSGAHFKKANLTSSNLYLANAFHADFSHSCMVNVNLSLTNLAYANFKYADVSETIFQEAWLEYTDFYKAQGLDSSLDNASNTMMPDGRIVLDVNSYPKSLYSLYQRCYFNRYAKRIFLASQYFRLRLKAEMLLLLFSLSTISFSILYSPKVLFSLIIKETIPSIVSTLEVMLTLVLLSECNRNTFYILRFGHLDSLENIIFTAIKNFLSRETAIITFDFVLCSFASKILNNFIHRGALGLLLDYTSIVLLFGLASWSAFNYIVFRINLFEE